MGERGSQKKSEGEGVGGGGGGGGAEGEGEREDGYLLAHDPLSSSAYLMMTHTFT